MSLSFFERYFLEVPRGFGSRVRLFFYRCFGLTAGRRNRIEAVRFRRLANIVLGDYNAFTAGCWLWPQNTDYDGVRIRIGNYNYFNRNLMIDACGYVEIGNHNMFGPDVYITDSNHQFGLGVSPASQPMSDGSVKIGSHCWIGAKAIILKDVALGDYCVVAAGAVVTKSFPAGSVVAGVPAQLLRAEILPEPALAPGQYAESEELTQ
jgi:acetyltransferase-like isoleucine patch superfamily enzyme